MKKRPFNKPLYYVYGTEECLVDGFIEDLRAAVIAPGFESMNYRVYHADDLDTTVVLTEARTMPAFSDRRLMVIKNASSLRAPHKKDLLPYIEDPSPWTVLVFVSIGPRASKDRAFMEAIRRNGEVRVFRSPGREGGLEWIVREARSQGKAISREAASMMLDLTGDSLTALKLELEKIILFVGRKERIEASDVSEAGLDVKTETLFDLSDAIGERDLERAFHVYSKVSREPPLKLMGAIARHMRVLMKIKAALASGAPYARLASIAGVPPAFVGKYRKGSRLFSMGELEGALRQLLEMNLALKTSAMPEDVAMSYLIIRLCSGHA